MALAIIVHFVDVVGQQRVGQRALNQFALVLRHVFFAQEIFDFIDHDVAIAQAVFGARFQIVFLERHYHVFVRIVRVGYAQCGNDGGCHQINTIVFAKSFFGLINVVV